MKGPLCCPVCLFARVAITKYRTLEGLNNRLSSSHRSGGWTSNLKVSAGLVSFETSLLACKWLLSLRVLTRSSLHVRASLVCLPSAALSPS